MLQCILLVHINKYANKISWVIHVFSYGTPGYIHVHLSHNLELMGCFLGV